MTGCAQNSERRGASMRAVMSVALPGENGTTIRTGLTGYLCCARAASGAAEATMPAATARATSRTFMRSPLCHRLFRRLGARGGLGDAARTQLVDLLLGVTERGKDFIGLRPGLAGRMTNLPLRAGEVDRRIDHVRLAEQRGAD